MKTLNRALSVLIMLTLSVFTFTQAAHAQLVSLSPDAYPQDQVESTIDPTEQSILRSDDSWYDPVKKTFPLDMRLYGYNGSTECNTLSTLSTYVFFPRENIDIIDGHTFIPLPDETHERAHVTVKSIDAHLIREGAGFERQATILSTSSTDINLADRPTMLFQAPANGQYPEKQAPTIINVNYLNGTTLPCIDGQHTSPLVIHAEIKLTDDQLEKLDKNRELLVYVPVGLAVAYRGVSAGNVPIPPTYRPQGGENLLVMAKLPPNVHPTAPKPRALTYDANGGMFTSGDSKRQTDTVTAGGKVRDYKQLQQNHMYVTSWNTKADGSGQTINAGTPVEQVQGDTLYAQWGKQQEETAIYWCDVENPDNKLYAFTRDGVVSELSQRIQLHITSATMNGKPISYDPHTGVPSAQYEGRIVINTCEPQYTKRFIHYVDDSTRKDTAGATRTVTLPAGIEASLTLPSPQEVFTDTGKRYENKWTICGYDTPSTNPADPSDPDAKPLENKTVFHAGDTYTMNHPTTSDSAAAKHGVSLCATGVRAATVQTLPETGFRSHTSLPYMVAGVIVLIIGGVVLWLSRSKWLK